MRELTMNEINAVSGGELTAAEGAGATLALMAISATPLVIGVGAAALIAYAWM